MGKNLLGFHQGFVGVHVSNCVLIMPRALSAVLVGPEQHHAANWPEATSMNPFRATFMLSFLQPFTSQTLAYYGPSFVQDTGVVIMQTKQNK